MVYITGDPQPNRVPLKDLVVGDSFNFYDDLERMDNYNYLIIESYV